jgi:exopolysaccharide production protein ExoQ
MNKISNFQTSDINNIYAKIDNESILRSGFQITLSLMLVCMICVQTTAPVSTLLKLANGGSIPGIGMIWYMAGFCGLFFFLIRPFEVAKAAIRAWPFLLLNLLALASFLWSVDRNATLKAALLLTMSQMGAMAIAQRYNWYQILKINAITMSILIFFSILLAVGVPKIGQMQEIYPGAWSGLWMEKQGLGFSSVIQSLLCVLLAVYFPKHKKWLFLAPLGIIALSQTESKTAIIMLVYGYAAIAGARLLQLEFRLSLILLLVGTVLATFLGVFIVSNPDLLFKLTGKSKDLTGRTEIWAGIDYLIHQRPTTGWGYNVIWDGKENPISPYQWISGIADFEPANAHSSYKESLLSLGKAGFYLLCLALAKVAFDAIIFMRSKPIAAAAALSIIGALFTISFTEMVFMGRMDYYWFLTVLIGTKLALQNKDNQFIMPPSPTEAKPQGAKNNSSKNNSTKEVYTY